MDYSNRKWVLLTPDDVSSIDFDAVMQNEESQLRWNNDNTKTFVKYEGSQPSFLNGKTELPHAQILTEVAKDEWVKDPPEE